MQLIDISIRIEPGMTTYRNNQANQPKITATSTHKMGSTYESRVDFNLHTGTHIDFPLHMIDGGKTGDEHDISKYMGICRVLDCTDCVTAIDDQTLQAFDIKADEFILLKTKNSFNDGFDDEFIYVDASGANYLAQQKIRGVGIDNLGIERSQPHHETHKTLLGNDIIILEGLRLAHVTPGTYTLVSLPLNIAGVEALPVRAALANCE
jgi:arylformamidase